MTMWKRRLVTALVVLLAAVAATGPAAATQDQVDVTRLGPQVGQAAPALSLPDQTGVTRTLAAVAGPKGTMVVFSRSADWCPYCRTQFVELQRNLADVTRQGYGVIAVTYDSQAVLKRFADEFGITYPMLSDEGSRVITAWGLLNTAATGRSAGIPHPGTFVIDRQGQVVSRAFEQAYSQRSSALSVLANLDAGADILKGATTVEGRQIRMRVGASDTEVAPGGRITLMLDIAAGEKMHVYAPGQKTYIPISLELDASEDLTGHATRYPASKPYHFVPLNETVQVFEGQFRVTKDVTIGLSNALRQRASAGATLSITGRLEYQACDDAVCYRPETLPVSWTVKLVPINRPGGRGRQ